MEELDIFNVVHCLFFFFWSMGSQGRKIFHCRGVRQGDSLSPMFFLFAIEPLHKLFEKATEAGLLSKFSKECDSFRVSLFADDASLFINPTENDLKVTIEILSIFAAASGLFTNMTKSDVIPYTVKALTSASLLQQTWLPLIFLANILDFLSITESQLGPCCNLLLRRLGTDFLVGRKKILSYYGREFLVKLVLSAMPTIFLTVHKMLVWGFSNIDRFRRSFLWRDEDPDKVKGGHCLINW
jgi:hypothetical protein